MVSRARQAGLNLRLRDVFEQQTLERLARTVQAPSAAARAAAEAALGAPTPSQAACLEGGVEAAALATEWVLCRTEQALDPERLERSLRALHEHHPVLRMRFPLGGSGQPQQAAAPLQLERARWDREPLVWWRSVADTSQFEAVVREAQQSLDLQRGPLLRAVGCQFADGRHGMLLVGHRVLLDTPSWRIVLADLSSAYQQLAQGRQPELRTPVRFRRGLRPPGGAGEHRRFRGRARVLAEGLRARSGVPLWRYRCARRRALGLCELAAEPRANEPAAR